MSTGRSTPWRLSAHARVIDAEEITLVYMRESKTSHKKQSGSPVGYLVRLYTERGEPFGWQPWVYTDSNRIQGRRPVGERIFGENAKQRAAKVAWLGRVIAPNYSAKAVPAFGLGSTHRRFL